MSEEFENYSLNNEVFKQEQQFKFAESTRKEFIGKLKAELEACIEVAKERLPMSSEEKDYLDVKFFDCMYVTNQGTIGIRVDYMLIQYMNFLLKSKKQSHLTIAPEFLIRSAHYLLSNIPYGPFIKSTIYPKDPSFYDELGVPFIKISDSDLRNVKDTLLKELQKIKYGTYVYHTPEYKVFDDSVLKNIIDFLEVQIKLPIDKALFDDEDKLLNYLSLKRDFKNVIEKAKSLTD